MKKIILTVCASLLCTQAYCSEKKSKAESVSQNKATIIGMVQIYNKDGCKITLSARLLSHPNIRRIESWEDSEKQVDYYSLRPLFNSEIGKKRKSFSADVFNKDLLSEDMRDTLIEATDRCWDEAQDFEGATTLWEYYSDGSVEMTGCNLHEEYQQAKKQKTEKKSNVKKLVDCSSSESENEGQAEMDTSE